MHNIGFPYFSMESWISGVPPSIHSKKKAHIFSILNEFLPWISSNSGVLLSDSYSWPNKIKIYYSFLLLLSNWQATEFEYKLPLIWPHPYHSKAYISKYSNIYGKTRILEFCSTSLVGAIRKRVYGTYPEVRPLSYNFLSKPVVLWKLMKRKHLKNMSFSPFFGKKCVFLELNMDLLNSLEISTSNKPHCRIIWLNIKGVECEKVVVSYIYTSCFRDMRHIYVGPTLWLRHKPMGVQYGYINIILHYINANVVSFSLKHIRV